MIKRTNDPVIDRILVDLQQQITDLKKSVNQPMQKDGSFFNGKDGDIRFIRGNDKKGYLEVKTSDGVYTTVTDIFQLMGKERPYPYFSDLLVDNLTAKTFTYKQMVGSNGDYVISDMAEVEDVTDTTITFKDLSNLNVCPFAQYDCIQALRVNASTGVELRNIKATVSSVSGRTVTVTYTSVAKAQVGDIFCRVGNTTTAGRQNIIYMSTIDNLSPTRAPFIDLYTAIDGFTTYGTVFRTQPKVRVGNLVGITDSDFGGALTGYGLYADNAYLKGKIYLANNGAISLGKTAYTDTTNAGFWIGDSDATATVNPYFYFGTASDAKYIKADLTAGTVNMFGIDISAGSIKSTATMTYDRGVAGTEGGYWIGKYGTNDYRFFIGSSATKYFKYDNTDLTMVGGTITGGTLQTAASGARVVLDVNGMRLYSTGKFSAGSSDWYYGTTRYMSMGLEVDLGAVTGGYLDLSGYDLTITALSMLLTGYMTVNGDFSAASSKFVVDANGNITKLNNITYSFPSVAPTLGQVLTCTNATGGVLGWATPSGGIGGSGTTNEIAYFTASTTLGSLSTATYPSLTELSYVKGLSSAVQTQINGKQATLVSGTNIKTINSNSLLGSGDLAVGGITSLNSLTGATQTFTNDTNVTITSSGTAHALGWSGSLAIARGGTANTSFTSNRIVYYDGSKLASSSLDVGSFYSAGLFDPAFGELYDNVASSTITTDGANYVKWTGSTVGEYANITGNTSNDNLTVNSGHGGIYSVSYTVTFTVSANDDYYWTVNISGTPSAKARAKATAVTSTTYSVSGTAIIELVATDTVDLGCYATNGRTVTVTYANLNIRKISN